MRIEIHHRCSDFSSYRAARVKSLFNAESGCNFDLTADLPIDDDAWRIGLVVGSSGSGKSNRLGGARLDLRHRYRHVRREGSLATAAIRAFHSTRPTGDFGRCLSRITI